MNLLDNYTKNSFEDIFYPNVPFENRKFNILKGYLLSVKMLIMHPFVFFKLMHVNKGYVRPFIFASINILLSVIFTDTYMYFDIIDTPAEQLTTLQAESNDLPVQLQEFLTTMGKRLPAFSYDFSTILLQSFGTMLNLLLLVMIWQTALSLFQLADNGLQATWRVICYSSVALLFNLLPLNQMAGGIFSILPGFLLIMIGLSEAHELSWKRTLLAAVSLPLVVMLFMLPFALL